MKLPTFYEVYVSTYTSNTYETDTETKGRYLYKSKALSEFRKLRKQVKADWEIDEERNDLIYYCCASEMTYMFDFIEENHELRKMLERTKPLCERLYEQYRNEHPKVEQIQVKTPENGDLPF